MPDRSTHVRWSTCLAGRLTGTQVEPIFGIPATGKVLEFTIASYFTFRDGMLVDYLAIAGALEALTQMGVTLEPATETASGPSTAGRVH